jgi:uncharacterized protein involved in response to NO
MRQATPPLRPLSATGAALNLGATWSRGYRPFFLGASIFSVLAMANWMAVYLFGFTLDLRGGVTPFQWHAHEMVYGYAMAVIAGFLLTAAWNWTGKKTASGAGLLAIFLPWLLARMLMAGGTAWLDWATAADLLFLAGLSFAIARPVLKARQFRQAPILLFLLLMTAARLLFWLGPEGYVADGARISVHVGLYLVLGMVLFMGRRVILFFSRRGVGYNVSPRNDRWNDAATLVMFPLFLLSEVFLPLHVLGALLAAALLVLNTLRLMGWYTMEIWLRPLRWSLFMAMLMVNLGFLLRALMPVTQVPPMLPLHAYAVGGIGIVTLSIMARVTLAQTGRNVHRAPPVTTPLMGGLLLAVALRIFLPLVDPTHYALWMGAAALAWMASFLLFIVVFTPKLLGKGAREKGPT